MRGKEKRKKGYLELQGTFPKLKAVKGRKDKTRNTIKRKESIKLRQLHDIYNHLNHLFNSLTLYGWPGAIVGSAKL